MVLVNVPGANVWSQLQHAAWNVLMIADLVVPAFLFAMGAALAFGRPRLRFAKAFDPEGFVSSRRRAASSPRSASSTSSPPPAPADPTGSRPLLLAALLWRARIFIRA